MLARCTCLVRVEHGQIYRGPGLFTHWHAAHGTPPEPIREWDLAISYASEDEKLAAAIHRGLGSQFRVFFAAEQEAYLWGEQLGNALPKLYGERSRFVLVICTTAYLAKYWPSVEFEAAKEKLGRSLLIIDAGALPPDLPGDIVYRRSDPTSMVSLVAILTQKLKARSDQR